MTRGGRRRRFGPFPATPHRARLRLRELVDDPLVDLAGGGRRWVVIVERGPDIPPAPDEPAGYRLGCSDDAADPAAPMFFRTPWAAVWEAVEYLDAFGLRRAPHHVVWNEIARFQ